MVETAETIIPDYFEGSAGQEVLEQIKKWIVSIIPNTKVTFLDHEILNTIPEALASRGRYFTGRHEAAAFERMFRDHLITKVRYVVGQPDEVSNPRPYLAPDDRNRCAVLLIGFYAGEQPILFRSIVIRDDGKIISVKDRV